MGNDNQPKRCGPWLPTRAMAKDLGANTYFTGKPCGRGHLSPRYTSSRNCVACNYQKIQERKENDPSYVIALRDYQRAYMSERRANDEDFRARQLEIGRKSDNRPERREHKNNYRKDKIANDPVFREKTNIRDRVAKAKWKSNNQEAVRASTRTRRARLKGVSGTHTAADIERIHKSQKYKCAECGISTREKRHVDHIIPIALGGNNGPLNLQILCPLCNDRKGAKDPLEWAKQNGRLV